MGSSLGGYQLDAGLALCAVVLALAVLRRDPRASLNRAIAAFGLALGLWMGASAIRDAGAQPHETWVMLARLGGVASVPLALYVLLALAPQPAAVRWFAHLTSAASALLVVQAPAWSGPAWRATTFVVMSLALAPAISLLARLARRSEPGPGRSAIRAVVLTAGLAGAGALLDLLPRTLVDLPRLGSLTLLPFLIVLTAVASSERFLGIDTFLARAIALGLAALAGGLVLGALIRLAGDSPAVLVPACLVLLLAGEPFARLLDLGARAVMRPSARAVAHALAVASRDLATVMTRDDVDRVMASLGATFPDGVRVVAHVTSQRDDVTSWLARERAPVTRAGLAEDVRRADDPSQRALAQRALDRVLAEDAQLVTPLLDTGGVAGWLALAGPRAAAAVNADVAAALMGVGNQAVASLERAAAVERARRASELAALGEMAAGLAHEVRNPAAAIRGAAHVLVDAKDPARVREMLDVVASESDRLAAVVGEFLDYARPPDPRRDAIDMEALVRDVLRQAELAGLGLRTTVNVNVNVNVNATCDGVLPRARGDGGQLARALGNILRNAREACGPDGSLDIELSASEDEIQLSVVDDGPGVPEALRARLFEPFATGRRGGTGLGLALAQRIVRAHGGVIEAGRPARGARFTLRLPVFGQDAAE